MYVDYLTYQHRLFEMLSEAEGMTAVRVVEQKKYTPRPGAWTAACQEQLLEYFHRERKAFTLSLLLRGTAFQQKVWNRLLSVPYGETISYAALAADLGGKNYTRAVARAVACNPLCILVPCHRVIGSDNSLTGYAWGLDLKRELLELERGC